MQHEVTIWAWTPVKDSLGVYLSLDTPEWDADNRRWRFGPSKWVCMELAERLVGEPACALENQTWPYGYRFTGDYNALAKVP